MKEALIEKIKTDGYCRIPQVFSKAEIKKALDLTNYWYEKTKNSATNLSALTRNDLYLFNPHYKDHYFLELFFKPAILHEILMHFLNDQWFRAIPQDQPNYILQNYMGRSSDRALAMHIDSFVPYHGNFLFMLQAGITLEEQTEENGCFVVIPGSHLSGNYVEQSAFKDAIPVLSQPGDLLIWDSRIWHGTMENKTENTRWSLIAAFSRWWVKQMFDYPMGLPQEIYEKLTDNQKAMLGFCSIPYVNEQEGVDKKRGYDKLLPHVDDYKPRPKAGVLDF